MMLSRILSMEVCFVFKGYLFEKNNLCTCDSDDKYTIVAINSSIENKGLTIINSGSASA